MGNVVVSGLIQDYQDKAGDFTRPGALKAKRCTLTMSSSYATGGEVFDATALTALGMQAITGVQFLNAALKTWSPFMAAGKVVLIVLGTGAEVANTTDVSTQSFTALVHGA